MVSGTTQIAGLDWSIYVSIGVLFFGACGYFFIIPYITVRKLKQAFTNGLADEIIGDVWSSMKARVITDMKGEMHSMIENPTVMQMMTEKAAGMLVTLLSTEISTSKGEKMSLPSYFASCVGENIKMRLLSESGNLTKMLGNLEKDGAAAVLPPQLAKLVKKYPFLMELPAYAGMLKQFTGGNGGISLSAATAGNSGSLATYG